MGVTKSFLLLCLGVKPPEMGRGPIEIKTVLFASLKFLKCERKK